MNQRPNFIFILMDDMGWRDLACSGSTFYETPNIDKLCRRGMSFANAYASCPVCSPSRASYLTGRYPARVGVTDWIDMDGSCHPLFDKLIDAPYIHHLPKDSRTIAHSLKEAGYATWHVGKWHLGGEEFYPDKFGFEKNIGGCSWGHPHCGYFSPYNIETLENGPDGEYLTDRITDEAINLIESDEERPFFMSLCHYAVHTPIQAKPEDIARFEKKAHDLGLDKEEAIIKGEHINRGRYEKYVERRVIQSDPAYAAMLWNLDQNIGRLVDALEKSGKADNTVIFFTSDNGGLSTSEGSPTCNLPASEGKGWMYEGGVRVPMFVVYPNHIKEFTRCDVPVTTPDFYPTILELAGLDAEPEAHCDGVSIAPLLYGKSMPERPIFWHYPHYGNQGGTPGSSVVLGKYKLIEFFERPESPELYDLETDFSEKYNIADKMPEKVSEMLDMLHKWQDDVCAKFPEKNPDYK